MNNLWLLLALSAAFVEWAWRCSAGLVIELLNPLGVRLERMWGMDISILDFNFLERLGYYLMILTGVLGFELFWVTIFLIVLFIWSLLSEWLATGEFYVRDLFLEWYDLSWMFFSAGESLLFFLLTEYIYIISYSFAYNDYDKKFASTSNKSLSRSNNFKHIAIS